MKVRMKGAGGGFVNKMIIPIPVGSCVEHGAKDLTYIPDNGPIGRSYYYYAHFSEKKSEAWGG